MLPRVRNRNLIEDDFVFNFTLLKTEANVHVRQETHTDEIPRYRLGDKTKLFQIGMITSFDKESLFYIEPYSNSTEKLVLLEEGDTIFFRLDIPYGGAENFTEVENVRLHTFCKVKPWDLPWNTGYHNKRCPDCEQLKIHWNEEEFKYDVKRDEE